MTDNLEDQMRDYPEGGNDDLVDGLIDQAINRSHRRYRVAYRLPVMIATFFVAALVTFGLPLLSGVAAFFGFAYMSIPENSFTVLWWITLWMVGCIILVGVGSALYVSYAVWASALTSLKRFWKILRDRF